MDNKFIKNILPSLGATALVIFVAVSAIIYIINFAEKQQTAIEPQNITPPNIQGVIPRPETQTIIIDLIKPEENYSIDGDPYSVENYKKKSRKLALKSAIFSLGYS